MNRKIHTPPREESSVLPRRAADDLDSHTDQKAQRETEALVKKAKDGDEAAFGALVEMYERFVYHTALRVLQMSGGRSEDGEDVAQNAFLKAWRSISSFREDCAFSTWLYRITVNCARDHCRTESRHPVVFLNWTDEDDEEVAVDLPVMEGDTVPEDVLDRRETILQVRKAIQSLPEEMRAVVLLRDIEELSYAEIADILHLETGTVKSRLNRARNTLKELLAGKL